MLKHPKVTVSIGKFLRMPCSSLFRSTDHEVPQGLEFMKFRQYFSYFDISFSRTLRFIANQSAEVFTPASRM